MLKLKKGRKVNINGVGDNIGGRACYTNNNENMVWEIIKMIRI